MAIDPLLQYKKALMNANCLTPKPLGVIFYNTWYYFLTPSGPL